MKKLHDIISKENEDEDEDEDEDLDDEDEDEDEDEEDADADKELKHKLKFPKFNFNSTKILKAPIINNIKHLAKNLTKSFSFFKRNKKN